MRFAAILLLLAVGARAQTPAEIAVSTTGRVASLYLSEGLVNRLLRENLQTDFLKDVSIELDSEKDQIEAKGLIKVPVEQLRAINLGKGEDQYRFQLAIRPKTTRHGHLILVFPFDQTFFYPDGSHDPKDKIVVPVQLLSLGLASVRGTLAQLSGDFSGFDRKTKQAEEKISKLERQLATVRNPDERAALEHDLKSAELELESIPLERRQAEKTAKKVEGFMKFVGEKEINLNDELLARRNALILRIQLAQLAPYLHGIELGGIRLLKDHAGQHFMSLDVDAELDRAVPRAVRPPQAHREPSRVAPEVAIRLNQALFESQTLLKAEKEEMNERIRGLSFDFKEDGVHISGGWKPPLLPQLPFASTLDFVWTHPDVFEIRVRDLKVAHIELAPLSSLLLRVVERRLDKSLQGVCSFEYLGKETDGSRALRATVDMSHLLPAFPKMQLMDVQVREGELVLKAGEP